MAKYMAVVVPYDGWEWVEGSELAKPSPEAMHIINAEDDEAAQEKATSWAMENEVDQDMIKLFRLEEVKSTTIDLVC